MINRSENFLILNKIKNGEIRTVYIKLHIHYKLVGAEL